MSRAFLKYVVVALLVQSPLCVPWWLNADNAAAKGASNVAFYIYLPAMYAVTPLVKASAGDGENAFRLLRVISPPIGAFLYSCSLATVAMLRTWRAHQQRRAT